MHTLLELYLSEVAAFLQPLSPQRRDEELQEMRQHLLNAIIVNREMGQSEDEAAKSAVAQFGTPTAVGENVVWAWRRQARQRTRRLLRKQNWRGFVWMNGVWGAYFIFEGFRHPHDVARSIYLLASLMLATGFSLLPLKYTPAWLFLKRGPLRLTWCGLITACVIIICVVAFFGRPHPVTAYIYPPLGDVALIAIFWYWHCCFVAKELDQDKSFAFV